MTTGSASAPVRLTIAHGGHIPAAWGPPREAVRTTTVAIREPRGVETFVTSWGTLTGTAGEDMVVIQDSGEEYPIKKTVLADRKSVV